MYVCTYLIICSNTCLVNVQLYFVCRSWYSVLPSSRGAPRVQAGRAEGLLACRASSSIGSCSCWAKPIARSLRCEPLSSCTMLPAVGLAPWSGFLSTPQIHHPNISAHLHTDTHCSFPSPAVHHGGIYHPWTARWGRMAVVLRLCKYQHHLRELRGGRGYGSSQGEKPEFCVLFNNGRTSSIVLSANGACPSDHISYISIP